MKQIITWLFILILFVGVVSCSDGGDPETVTAIPSTPTAVITPTAEPLTVSNENAITVVTTAPTAPFEFFDDFGSVTGFDVDFLDSLSAETGHSYEFVVTTLEGMLDSVAQGEFDIAVSPYISGTLRSDIAYTEPYLEVGQVLVVLANERDIISYNDVRPGMRIGVLENSIGRTVAEDIVGVPETDLVDYVNVGQMLQALINRDVRGVIMDDDDAMQYTETYFQQLKIAGDAGQNTWITSQSYVIAVNANNAELYQSLNRAITQLREDGTIERLTRSWLVSNEAIDPGESLVGTPADVIVMGVMGDVTGIDPAGSPNPITWEIKRNTMSGLFKIDPDNNLVPDLAAGVAQISPDQLEYTIALQSGLSFPDGTPLSAEDVKWSIDRASAGGSWHVNTFLKDTNGDFLADADAIEVVDPTTLIIRLKAPTAYFLYALATPPYFIANQNCYATNPNPTQSCNGIGPYQIVEWETNERIQLLANPEWATPPTVDNIQLRFFNDLTSMREALDLGAIDMVWAGLHLDDASTFADVAGVAEWAGPANFKSYIVFEQSQPPWDNPNLRQAAAFAVDREALASLFGGRRTPLDSPVPTSVPGYVSVEPARDVEQAIQLLTAEGYSAENPLAITLHFLNDGRYSRLEEVYAQAIKAQLEETGIFQVTLEGAEWATYSGQISACSNPAFLLAWPPAGWPSRYPAAMGWMDYFITNTELLCSNYQSPAMTALVQELRALSPLDTSAQLDLYAQIQTLWAEEFPTLDLTQSAPVVFTLPTVGNVQLDLMGLLHYELLTKQ